jgi:hypothetical protein
MCIRGSGIRAVLKNDPIGQKAPEKEIWHCRTKKPIWA